MNAGHQKALYQYADQYGVPRNIAFALVRQESGGNPNAKSPVGAEGYTQLMPGTARGLGVNPANPLDNLRGGMMYLGNLIKQFGGNVRLALAAYNAGPGAVKRYGGIPPYAETQKYVRNIMSMAGPATNAGYATQTRLKAVNAGLATPTGPQIGAVAPQLSAALEMAQPSEASQNILARLGGTASKAAEAATAPIPLPASQTPVGGGPSLPGSDTLAAVAQSVGGKMGRVAVAPGANRAGVALDKGIIAFARKVSGEYGKPFTITTGTNHNQYVLGTTRVSAHWVGRAVDIAAKGAKLTAMGQAALIAAGAKPAWARKQKGGLFNIGGYQIIFNSNEGGNHYNHLHLGLEGHHG